MYDHLQMGEPPASYPQWDGKQYQPVWQCPVAGITRQLDHAKSHSLKHTVAFLQINIPDFTEPPNWPSNSPDLNPYKDYSIWSTLCS